MFFPKLAQDEILTKEYIFLIYNSRRVQGWDHSHVITCLISMDTRLNMWCARFMTPT